MSGGFPGLVSTSRLGSLGDIPDIDVAGATDGEGLRYNSGTGLWESARFAPTTPETTDFAIDIGSLGTGASAPDLLFIDPPTNLIRAYCFDGNVTTEQLWGQEEILHQWKEGSAISIHFHWSPTTAAVGTAKFYLDYRIANIRTPSGPVTETGEFSALQTLEVQVTTPGAFPRHMIAAFPDITMTGRTLSCVVAFRLYRVPSTEPVGKYPDDIALLRMGIHAEMDAWGSTTRYTK